MLFCTCSRGWVFLGLCYKYCYFMSLGCLFTFSLCDSLVSQLFFSGTQLPQRSPGPLHFLPAGGQLHSLIPKWSVHSLLISPSLFAFHSMQLLHVYPTGEIVDIWPQLQGKIFSIRLTQSLRDQHRWNEVCRPRPAPGSHLLFFPLISCAWSYMEPHGQYERSLDYMCVNMG